MLDLEVLPHAPQTPQATTPVNPNLADLPPLAFTYLMHQTWIWLQPRSSARPHAERSRLRGRSRLEHWRCSKSTLNAAGMQLGKHYETL
jgi:hypothetical protein